MEQLKKWRNITSWGAIISLGLTISMMRTVGGASTIPFVIAFWGFLIAWIVIIIRINRLNKEKNAELEAKQADTDDLGSKKTDN